MNGLVPRFLALDVGEKRIGVAVSDALGLTAQGVETIHTRGAENDRARIRECMARYDAQALVVGLPRNMDGTQGYQAERVRAFVAPLEAAGVTVYWQDERMTSMQATRVLLEGNVRRDKRKDVIDKLAATYILQSFLDARGVSGNKTEDGHMDREDSYMERENPIVELIDEEGKTVRFEHIYTVPYQNDEYVLLAPVDEIEDIGEDEVIIMRIEPGEDDDQYIGIEDDALLEKVFNKYLEMVEDDDAADADEEADEDK